MSKLAMLAFGLATTVVVLAACGGQGQEIGVQTAPTSTIQATPTVGTSLEKQAELCQFSGSYSDNWYMLCSVYDGVYDFLFVVRRVETPDKARIAKTEFEQWLRVAQRIEDPCSLNVHIVYPNLIYEQMNPSDDYLSGCAEGEGP